MKVETLKDLEAMLKVCRKQGVLAIKVDGIELSLGDAPDAKLKQDDKGPVVEDELSSEDILFWSSTDRV